MCNWQPIAMDKNGSRYTVNRSVPYTGIYNISSEDLNNAFEFAYNMAYDNLHRDHRTGGTHRRRRTEIFVNTLQGKLSELFLRNLFLEAGIRVSDVDTNLYDRGEWDSEDLSVFTASGREVRITIKSTKSFGNLMLLETKDWNSQANYIPSGDLGVYDVFALVRVRFELERILRDLRIYFSDNIPRNKLLNIINSIVERGELSFDIPGCLSRVNVEQVILVNQKICRSEYLNNTPMDADNYYIQSGNMESLDKLCEALRKS